MEPFKVIKLEIHDTRDVRNKHVNGTLTVLWRDWDNIIKNPPKMVYITSVNPSQIKGPHLHTKRNSYFSCIQGKVAFIIRDDKGKYHEKILSEDDPILLHVSNNIASAHINLSKDTSKILVLADVAWRPDDQEMKNVSFDDYDWSKWKT